MPFRIIEGCRLRNLFEDLVDRLEGPAAVPYMGCGNLGMTSPGLN
jgi:hypothetical protein